MSGDQTIHEDVKEYYGKILQTSGDLKTSACTASKKKLPQSVTDALGQIHDEVVSKYYGCGPVFPECVTGCRVVDLGSGSGRDCYILSKLVGPSGFVTGVDMTREQLEVSRKHIGYHMNVFGYSSPNVEFVEGYIEDLGGCGIAKESNDVIVSNCVINLSPDKRKTLWEAYQVLKPGGEMYFSDVYADRPIPADVRGHKLLYGECVSGALAWQELMDLSCQVGFAPPILVDVAPIAIEDPKLKEVVGDIKFCSATYRLFKVTGHEAEVGNYEEVQYKGTIPDFPNQFQLSHDVTLSALVPTLLPSSVASVLKRSRFSSQFSFSVLPASSGEGAACSELAKFTSINPFEVLASRPTAPDKGSSCCSSTCASSPRSCC